MMNYDHDGNFLILLIYVDNMLFSGNNFLLIEHFTENLNSLFSLKDLGDLGYFFGIDITSTKYGLYLSQSKYINDQHKRFN